MPNDHETASEESPLKTSAALKASVAEAFGLPDLYDPTDIIDRHDRLVHSATIDAQVHATMTPLKYDPDDASETLTYLLKGEPLQVLGETEGWQLVVSVIDGYLGWIDIASLRPDVLGPTHRVNMPLSHIYSAPDIKSKPTSALVMGSYVTITGSAQNSFMPLKEGGWVFEKHLAIVGQYQSDPVLIAESMIGAPYLWGGRSALGIDCSGLVQVALASCGHRVHRDSGAQFESLGRLLEDGETPMRGDLAFFPGHVGWMLDSLHILHANSTQMAVTIDTVNIVIKRIAQETELPPFSGFKRL